MGLHRHGKTIDRDAAEAPAAGGSATVALHPASGARFSPIEAHVIALARQDTLASLEPPSWIERAAALLFGIEFGRKPLADARLEALRRAVVVTHHRRHMPDAVAVELARAGYRLAQVRAIEALAIAG